MATFQIDVPGGGGGGLGGLFGGIKSGIQDALGDIRRAAGLPAITLKNAAEAAKEWAGKQTLGGIIDAIRGGGNAPPPGDQIRTAGENVAGKIQEARRVGSVMDVVRSPVFIAAAVAGAALFLGSRRR